MEKDYTVYINGNYFDLLRTPSIFTDRPEPYRLHEKSLWAIYQLLKLGEHEVVITDKVKQVAIKTKDATELRRWYQEIYPDSINQLDQPVYTKFPHPKDKL